MAVRIHGPAEFQDWLAQLTKAAADGDEQATLKRQLVLSEMAVLRALTEPPGMDDETAELKWVRQIQALSGVAGQPSVPSRCRGAADLLVPTGRAGRGCSAVRRG